MDSCLRQQFTPPCWWWSPIGRCGTPPRLLSARDTGLLKYSFNWHHLSLLNHYTVSKALHCSTSTLYASLHTLRNTGGFLNTPTPGGVPVRKTSPGVKVTNLAEQKTRGLWFRSRTERSFVSRGQQIKSAPECCEGEEGLRAVRVICTHISDISIIYFNINSQQRDRITEAKNVCVCSCIKWKCTVHLLWNPGDQRLRLEDHLVRVAALHCVSVHQAAHGQAVRVWRGNGSIGFTKTPNGFSLQEIQFFFVRSSWS